jgi:acyl-coenzyme A thioesterase PaaI-like protein
MSVTVFDPLAHGWALVPGRGFPSHLGAFFGRESEGAWRYGFVAEERHLNFGGVVHGGMLMTFMDDMLGRTVWEAAGQKPVSTIQLNNRFVAPGRLGDFIECVPRIERLARSVAFIRGELLVGDRLVMASDGVWKLLGQR